MIERPIEDEQVTLQRRWYCVPHTGEIGSYSMAGELNDFSRGVYLAYGQCCLTTGFRTRPEAEAWMKKHPCEQVERTKP